MAQNGTQEWGKGLKPNQIKAMEALLSGQTVAGAASAGASRTTLNRWLRDNWEFQAALNQRQREVLSAVQAGVVKAAQSAAAPKDYFPLDVSRHACWVPFATKSGRPARKR